MIGSMALFPYHEAGLGLWRVVISAVVAFSVARLSGHFIAGLWRRRAVYGMFIVLIVHQLLQFYDLAQPLFRLYILIVSLIGLFLCLWRMPTTVRRKELRLYRWALRGGIAYLRHDCLGEHNWLQCPGRTRARSLIGHRSAFPPGMDSDRVRTRWLGVGI
jgi:hypothetical protein